MTETDSNNTEEGMDLFDHLAELRRRLLIVVVVVFIFACLLYTCSNALFYYLAKPYLDSFSGNMLIGTGPAEAFILKLKVAFFSAIVFGSPVIFYQLWLFIAPGLYEKEKKLVLPFVFFTSLLFLLGAAFCYYIVLPYAFDFFKGQYDSIAVTPTIRISEHLSLILKAIFGFGCVFEVPVLAFFLARLGILNHRMLLKGFRYAVVLIFVISAILTPPDVLTQFLMAGPLLLLYGISILIVKAVEKQS